MTAKYFKKFMLIAAVFFIVLLFLPSNEVQAVDTDGDTLDNDIENLLITRFSPKLTFHADENFYPVDVSYFLGISEKYRWNLGVHQLLDPAPTEANLHVASTDQYFLKCKLSYEDLITNYQSGFGGGFHVYAHVLPDSGYVFVQYWFFYVYNDGPINQHEGDWEMIQIKLEAGTYEPISAQYSQHHGGETAAWADVEKTGDQPHVYVARGSHANYFRPFQGSVGLENDEVADNGRIITSTSYTVENLGEKGFPLGGNAWINYQGRWGNWENLPDADIGFAGPRTMGYGENADKWTNPNTWASSLFEVNTGWFTLCWIMYYLLYIILAIFAILVIRKLYKIYKVNKKGGLLLKDVLKTRASLGIILGISAIVITIVAIFLPWYVVSAEFSGTISAQGDIFVLDGLNGVSVNFLVTDTGLTPLFSLGVPFGLIIGMGIILNALDIVGVDKPKKLGNGYIRSGIFFLILLAIVLLLMTQFGALMSAYGIPQAASVTNAISQAPFGGTYSTTIYSVDASFAWGFAMGGLLLLAAAFIKIFAGAIIRSAPAEFA